MRGVDGTPLNALNRIVLTGQKMDVFNGEWSRVSSVPVAAPPRPAMFSEIEVGRCHRA